MSDSAARRSATAHRQQPGWLGRIGPVAVNQVALALSLGLFAVVTGRALGPSGRGIVVIFMTLSSLLMLIGSLGTNTAARVRLVARGQPLLLEHYLALVVVLSA